MDLIIICFTVFSTAILTFFSGFGLGTVLLPVFMFFFPVEIAVALTGAVHFTNSSFKASVTWKSMDRIILLKFGIPAIIASFAGAVLLGKISQLDPLYQYTIGLRSYTVTPVKLVIAVILLVFSAGEVLFPGKSVKPGAVGLISGGVLSGFFGGIAGLQGALRGAFLIRTGLSGAAYIATSAVIAMLVDLTRLPVYYTNLKGEVFRENASLLIFSVLSGIAGAYTGTKLLRKVTMRFIQVIVTILLVIISVALGLGLI